MTVNKEHYTPLLADDEEPASISSVRPQISRIRITKLLGVALCLSALLNVFLLASLQSKPAPTDLSLSLLYCKITPIHV
jgi:hypothetical protein